MQSLLVVYPLDEATYRLSGLFVIFVVVEIDFLVLEGAKETLRLGVVTGRSLPRHADRRSGGSQQLNVVPAGVLHPPVRMMHPASGWLPACYGLPQRAHRQLRVDALRQL